MAAVDSSKNVDGPAEAIDIRPPLWGSARFAYTICAFFAMIFHLSMRNILNFAILYMVKPQQSGNFTKYNTTSAVGTCSTMDIKEQRSDENAGDLLWTRSQEFIMTGSFYYGFLIVQPVAGRLADRFGGKLLFVHSLTIQAVIFMLIPFFARKSYIGAVIVRAVQGVIAACGAPALYQLFSTWAHPSERTVFLSIAYTGYSVGSVLVFPVASFLRNFGWEYIFYAVGSFALFFGICCQWLIYNTLEDHPRLSKEEFNYLNVHQGEQSTTKVPWKSLLTSLPVYAFILTHFFHSYSDFAFTLLVPRYFKEAMNLPLDRVSLLSSVPYLGVFISKALSISTCNIIEGKPNLNLTILRRIAYVVCNCVTIMFIFGMIHSSCEDLKTVVLFATLIALSADMGFSGAYWPSLLHLAPALAGFISGLANCLATINGFLTPFVISVLVRHGSKSEWNLVLLTTMASFIISAFVYGLFGSSKLAKWSEPKCIEEKNHPERTAEETN